MDRAARRGARCNGAHRTEGGRPGETRQSGQARLCSFPFCTGPQSIQPQAVKVLPLSCVFAESATIWRLAEKKSKSNITELSRQYILFPKLQTSLGTNHFNLLPRPRLVHKSFSLFFNFPEFYSDRPPELRTASLWTGRCSRQQSNKDV